MKWLNSFGQLYLDSPLHNIAWVFMEGVFEVLPCSGSRKPSGVEALPEAWVGVSRITFIGYQSNLAAFSSESEHPHSQVFRLCGGELDGCGLSV